MLGIIKPQIDAHIMGINIVESALRLCGRQTCLTEKVKPAEIAEWIQMNRITEVAFSYRLNPTDAVLLFDNMYSTVKACVSKIYFASLPEACLHISEKYGGIVPTFSGGEGIRETLRRLGIPEESLPASLSASDPYDTERDALASELVSSHRYETIPPTCSVGNNFTARFSNGAANHTLPLIRAHCGPYSNNREDALELFYKWTTQLNQSGYMDVLSIGSSQLTQECFEQDWSGKPNGGGVPVHSRAEYERIRQLASPMLVRTYAGSTDVAGLAQIYEESLDIAWHALSFWWFCETDGRGKNTLLQNLRETFDAVKYIASTNKPLESNVAHHFAFRGADDISCIVAGFLAIKVAKRCGVRDAILQYMQNNPRPTSGVQDIAKARTLLKLARELEDDTFRVYLQTRVGLDYLSKDIEKAKAQLAAVTFLMDDIEPTNVNSPEVLHVVSYSEANDLATPEIINESIQITRCALKEYRERKSHGDNLVANYEDDISWRENALYAEAKAAIVFLETNNSDLYTPEGFFTIFRQGFFQMPYLFDENNKYSAVKTYSTRMFHGGVFCVDEKGEIIDTIQRYTQLLGHSL